MIPGKAYRAAQRPLAQTTDDTNKRKEPSEALVRAYRAAVKNGLI